MSGVFCLCFGKPRFSVKDTAKNRVGSFCVNLVIGIAQLFTIVFCLVGWGWSIWWGVIMYRLASKSPEWGLRLPWETGSDCRRIPPPPAQTHT
ncbi:UNVERIFIED_CONTAM: hypothetical protein PYX00_006329 [Menopon gallinae]|uniref:Uncharacterized protein n=1 Tax=Menopon gallinae TaxID=328185 RepID=A0AAW2HWA9_9NEOP